MLHAPIGLAGSQTFPCAFRAAVLLLALLLILAPVGSLASPHGSGDAFVLLHPSTMDDLWAFVEEWEDAGARFPHIYPPDVLIGDVPSGIEAAMSRDARVAFFARKPAVLPPFKGSGLAGILASSWNEERGAEDLPLLASAPGCVSLLVPAVTAETPPPEPGEEGKTYGRAFGANYFQTSEWMLGKVAVGVILPDFAGHAYAPSEVASVVEAVRGAMNYWTSQVKMIPGVRFVYEVRTGVPTSMDFMTHQPRMDEEIWVPEVMGRLGYTARIEGSAAGPVYEYIDSLRTRCRTEWGICLFLPKVPSFRAPYTAYSHFGGPFLAAPGGVQKDEGRLVDGSIWLTHLLIHETGHLFWVLDESCESGFCVPCHVRSGYLSVYNKNSTNRDYTCAPHHVACAMDVPAPFLCEYSLAQAGVLDTDGDLIPDVLDTNPFIYADTLPDTITTVTPLLTGIAAEIPLVNWAAYSGIGAHGLEKTATVARNDVTFNSIEHVVYRIDGIVNDAGEDLWLYADPEGGWGGDSTRVHFAFTPDSLTGGNRTITIRGINSAGNRSSWGERVMHLFVKAIALRELTALPDYDGAVRVSFRVRGETFGATASLYRSVPGLSEALIRTFTLRPDAAESILDREALPGVAAEYRLEVSALGMTWNYRTSVTTPAPLRRGTFLSQVTPNPFRDRTVISYRVPRGDPTDVPPGNGGKPRPPADPPLGSISSPEVGQASLGRYQLVRVEIEVFNLAGRRVRAFPRVHSYEGIFPEPVIWDGTDDSGKRLPPGVYFVRLVAGDVRETRKVLLLP